MAEAVLFNIAGEIITKLGSQALKEIGLCWGVKDELEKLKRTVSTIKAVLLDAEERSSVSMQVKNWVEMLKEAVYDADDLVDEFSTEALRQQALASNRMSREVRLFFSRSNQLTYGLKMAHKIKAIRDRLDDISANRNFHLEERLGERIVTRTRSREQTHSSAPEIVIGREHEKEAIIEFLLSSNCEENVGIIPIVGIGGLGKTTLAQLVFNDDRVKLHFELKIWVCISDNFDTQLIVEKILESASSERPRNQEMDALKNLLHEKINGKKYLLVLDDVWNEDSEKWFRLKDLLIGGARGSKIIITTRLKNVARMTRSVSSCELQGLSEIESWSLFKQIAFKRGQVPSPSYEAIGREIVAKCRGVPLAIKTIGALLYFKETESEWLSFKDTELSEVDQQESGILPTLKLSYNKLPSHLKPCFAYCALFPKDYRIDVQMLIHLWRAQGYIQLSNPSQCFVDVGLEYFKELHWRSFFQEVGKDGLGNISHCKMHDLMHDLATLMAGKECVLSNSKMINVDGKTRHLSLEFDTFEVGWEVSPAFLQANKLRTLLLFVKRWPDDCYLNLNFSNVRRLRVLTLDSSVKKVPPSIDKLKHLRYLDLSFNPYIKTLRDSITSLQNLQVLRLERCQSLKQLPKDIKRLVNLQHLGLRWSYFLTNMPCEIGQLTSLEHLSRFVLAENNSILKRSAGLSDLNGLNKLRGELVITNLQSVCTISEFEAANLKEKQHLQKLKLVWNEDRIDNCGANDIANDEMGLEALRPHQNLKILHVESYRGMKVPSWISSLINLVHIAIYNCQNIHRLPPLDQFPFLKVLMVFGLTNLEYIDTENEGGTSAVFFPSLTSLIIYSCPKLKGWWRCKRDAGMTTSSSSMTEMLKFQCLCDLRIESCPNLSSIPLLPALSQVKSLKDREDFEFVPEKLQRNLVSRRILNIVGCSDVKTVL